MKATVEFDVIGCHGCSKLIEMESELHCKPKGV